MLFCLVHLYWVFIKSIFVVGSEVIAVCDILISKTLHFFVIACCGCFWVFFIEKLCGLFVVVFLWLILRLIDEIVFRVCFLCFERIIDWVLRGLFFLIVWFDWLFRLVVFYWTVVILCGRRKIYGRTVHCNVAFVKHYVKMSALWFKRLIFWFGRVLFVVKTVSCSERRFASGTS